MRVLLPLRLAFELAAESAQQRHVFALEDIGAGPQRASSSVAGVH